MTPANVRHRVLLAAFRNRRGERVEKRERFVDRKTPAPVMEVLLPHGRLVSLKVFEREQFQKLEEMATPFTRRVQEEGVSL